VTEKGIDPARVVVVTGSSDSQQVENYLLPRGAALPANVSTTPVNENNVHPEHRKPLPVRPHHKKPAEKNPAKQ
jgi:hypothetical protein